MKLTKEQEKQIQKRLDETPYYGHCTIEYYEGIEDGAKWAIEKFGGMQWNKYPETKPTEDGYYLLWDENGPVEDMHVAYVFVDNPEERLSGSTHWAEINLPNQ